MEMELVRDDLSDVDSDTLLHTSIFDSTNRSSHRTSRPSSSAPAAAAASSSASSSAAANHDGPATREGSHCKICHKSLQGSRKLLHRVLTSNEAKNDWMQKMKAQNLGLSDEDLERMLTAKTHRLADGTHITYWLVCKPCEQFSHDRDCTGRHEPDGTRKPSEPEKQLINAAETEAMLRMRHAQQGILPESAEFRQRLLTCLNEQFRSFFSVLGDAKRQRMLLMLPIALVSPSELVALLLL
jgi:hypothetical protein